MNLPFLGRRLLVILLASASAVPCLAGPRGNGARFGLLSGAVTDPQGNPLMGATVLVMGAAGAGPNSFSRFTERVITDAQGRFMVAHLAPGWYSLRVTSPTRLPAQRTSVRVEAGQSAHQTFVLTGIFAPLRLQIPQGNTSTWGEDWKWVLRTSATTRPILRFQGAARSTSVAKSSKPPLPASQRLIGLTAGATRREALAGDPGLGSILAYLRPLSQDSDLLVAGSMTASGILASSLATAFRKNLNKGDPQILTLVVHQLSFTDGFPILPAEARGSLARAQGVALSYSHTRRLFSSLSLTTGLEIDYLNAVRDAVMARPSMKLEYQANPSTRVTARYGSARVDGGGSLMDRIGLLNAFPRVTLRGYRPRLENLNHAEVAVSRKFDDASEIEVAAFQDDLQNAAVWGFHGLGDMSGLAGEFLPNPASGGLILNAGHYRSSGFRTSYTRKFGNHMETALAYATGSALTAEPSASFSDDPTGGVSRALRAQRSQSLAGKVSARVPVSKTQIITSYAWQQRGRVTGVDPYGQAALQLPPYLGVLVRQPLPTLAFLPLHIEALADFRNLLAQGYVPLSRTGERPLLLTSAYRSLRGGFSVEF